MNDGDALRRAVVANRDDDTPRLIYADWLDEYGQPERAAFIRAQMEAARAEPYSFQARSAETKANRLLESHRKAWTRHLQGKAAEVLRFQRGFIEHVAVEPISIDVVAGLFNLEPIESLRVVRPRVEDGWISFAPVFELSELRQIRQLEFTSRSGFIHDEYTGLLESPHLAGVQKLSFRGNPIHPPWLLEMLAGDAFPELSGLDVADITNLGPGLLNAVIGAVHRELKCLDASRVVFSSDQLQRVLASPCLQYIEELRLGFVGHTHNPGPLFQLDIGWVIPWERLVVLDLAGQWLGDVAVKEIVAREEAQALRWLGLSNNDLGTDSIRQLVNSKHLDLNYLDIRGNRFPPSAIAALQQRFPEALIVH